jgi:ribosome maturation factor RimP
VPTLFFATNQEKEEVVMGSTEGIRELAGPALTSAGLELWDVEVSRDIVRILVDRPGGIDLEGCAEASRVVSPLLDQRPDLAPDGLYQLEVSSPGVERTLRSVEQYRRYIGAEVAIKTNVPVEGSRRHHGTLVHVDEAIVRLHPKDTESGSLLELRHDQIDRTRTVLVWGPTPRPSAKRKAASRSSKVGVATGPSATAAHDPKDTGS